MSASEVTVTADELRRFCADALEAVGAAREDAEVVADSLVDSDLRGVDTHGIPARLPNYIQRVRGGGIVPDATVETIADHGAIVTLDAGDGFGQVAADKGMRTAIDRASVHGVGVVGVRASNHVGAMSYWSRMATEQGMVGFALSGAAPAIAPWGGVEKLLGSNPWSLAYPTAGGRPPLAVDVSNGVVIYGKIRAAANQGEKIPSDWGLDPQGRPTEDPEQAIAGSLAPFGGAKGAALTLAFEVLGSVLTGAAYSRHVPELSDVDQPQRLGHIFAALPVDRFLDPAEFTARLEELIGWIEGCQPAEGFDEVRVPGARGERALEQRQADGIPMTGRIDGLSKLAGDLSIDAPRTHA